MKEKIITKDMTIEEIFTKFPQQSQRLAQTMTNIGLHCAGCSAATWETLEAGMYGHGFDDQKIVDLVDKLNEIINEKIDHNSITLTKTAANKFLSILKEENKQGYSLRLMEKAAGCNGFEYVLDFSEKPTDDDLIFESNGIEIHIKKNDSMRLIGCYIDYVDGLQGAGFKISNPNVKSSCSCGTSHSY
jgi:iron-sulfur cluster assembly accessory protein